MVRAWSSWPSARRRAVVLAAVGLAAAAVVWTWAARPQFVPLYSRLDVQEAARVVDALQQMGVPYRLVGAGTTVEVPRDRVYAVRLRLASQGLPRSGGVGFELFDRASFGATELVQRVNLQRALAGELARSIETLESVESARVHLAVPEDRLFRDESTAPSASVVVALRPGAGLTAGQVRAIRHLVANSVQGLLPERVTVVDTQGRLLSAGQDDPSGVNTAQLGEREQVEAALQQRLQRMLDEVLGPGRALVQVSAEVDFSRRQVEQESFLPDQRAPTSEVTVEESYAGRGTPPAGGPATVSVPSYAQSAPAGGGGSEYRRRESRTTYQVTRRVERSVSTGGIRRLSVAVLVDRRVPQTALQALESAVAAGAGLDRRRGDVLVVRAVDFPSAAPPGERPAEPAQPQARPAGVPAWASVAAAAVGVLVVLVLVLLRVLRRRRRPEVKVETLQPAPVPAAVPEPEEDEEERILRALREREDGQQATFRRELQRVAQERPADIAAVLRSWMAER